MKNQLHINCVLSMLVILLSSCCILITISFMTNQKKEINDHLKTGNLSFQFEIINQKKYEFDYLISQDSQTIDLSNNNALKITNLLPGEKLLFTMQLKNTGTTYFRCDASIFKNEIGNEFLVYFVQDEQLKSNLSIKEIQPGESQFLLMIVELSSNATNDYQKSSFNVNVKLNAVQIIK